MGKTPCELFRAGNSSSARLDNVRPSDVTIVKVSGVDTVRARSGGISTHEAIDPTLNGIWWRLPAGTDYNDNVLFLNNDQTGHWSWEPTQDFPVSSYRAALASVNVRFIVA